MLAKVGIFLNGARVFEKIFIGIVIFVILFV
jgi:hypothetical protein